MSKNIEIVAEIIADETKKLEKLVLEQAQLLQEFSICMEKAEKIAIEPDLDRLLEVVSHWNQLFTAQKKQIQELQNDQNDENKKQRLWIFMMLILTIILLLSILLILTFKTI